MQGHFQESTTPLTEVQKVTDDTVILFFGSRANSQGITHPEAEAMSKALSGPTRWVGRPAEITFRPALVEEGRRRVAQRIKRHKSPGRTAPDESDLEAQGRPKRKPRKLAARFDTEASDTDASDEDPHSSAGDCSSAAETTDAESSRRRAGSRRNAPRRSRNAPRGQGRPKGKLRLPTFKDENVSTGVSYRQWRHDVKVAQQAGWPDAALLPEIHFSLSGTPGELARTLDPTTATVAQVLQLLDKHYGGVKSLDLLEAQMATLKQEKKESAADFATRLCHHLAVLSEQYPEEYPPEGLPFRRLRRFYGGLRDDLQNALAYKRDTPGVTFEEMLEKARQLEARREDSARNHTEPTHGGGDNRRTPAPQRPSDRYPAHKPRGTLHMRASQADDITVPEIPQDEDLSDDGEDVAGRLSELFMKQMELAKGQAKVQDRITRIAKDNRLIRCYNCNEMGHYARDCPKPPRKGAPTTVAAKQLNSNEGTTSKGSRLPPTPTPAPNTESSLASDLD